MWPKVLLRKLESFCLVVRADFRGLHSPEYKPSIQDIVRDIRRLCNILRRDSPWSKRLRLYLLGYSFGGMAVQLVISDRKLCSQFAGFILIATACEFIPAAFERSYVGKGRAPLESVDLVKSVFSSRVVPAGRISTFVEGSPDAWYVVSKPDGGPLMYEWSENFLTSYLPRKLRWLFPEMRLVVGRATLDYLYCPPTPEHFSPRYVDFATSLMLETDTASGEQRPGQGLLFKRLAQRIQEGPCAPDQRVLIVTGSKDALFPLEHCVSLGRVLTQLFADVQTVVYCAEQESFPVAEQDLVKLHKIANEPGGHALLFQDNIARHFAGFLAAWIQGRL